MKYDVAASRHSQHCGEEPVGTETSAPVAAKAAAINAGSGIYHAVGSSVMGPQADDVVDPQLRVRGVTGLRVAGASSLPPSR